MNAAFAELTLLRLITALGEEITKYKIDLTGGMNGDAEGYGDGVVYGMTWGQDIVRDVLTKLRKRPLAQEEVDVADKSFIEAETSKVGVEFRSKADDHFDMLDNDINTGWAYSD